MSESIIVSKLRHGFLVTLRDRDTGEGVDDVAACSTFGDLTTWLNGHFSEPAPAFNIAVRGASEETLASLAAELDARIARSAIKTGIHQRPSQSDESSPEAGPQVQASLVGTDAGTPADREGRDEGEAALVYLPTIQPETALKLPAQESGGTEVSSESEPLGKSNAARPASVDAHVNDGSAAGEVAHEVVTGGESAASNQPEAASEKVGGVTGACSALVMRREPGVDADKTGVTGGESAAAIPDEGPSPLASKDAPKLTDHQSKVLDYLRAHASRMGSDTVSIALIALIALAAKSGIPKGSIYYTVSVLAKAGLMKWKAGPMGAPSTFVLAPAGEAG